MILGHHHHNHQDRHHNDHHHHRHDHWNNRHRDLDAKTSSYALIALEAGPVANPKEFQGLSTFSSVDQLQ